MIYDVLLTKEGNQEFTARPLLIPSLVVSGPNEAEVLERLRATLLEVQAKSRTVQLEVPTPRNEESDSWLRFAGMWADDPDWDEFQARIEANGTTN